MTRKVTAYVWNERLLLHPYIYRIFRSESPTNSSSTHRTTILPKLERTRPKQSEWVSENKPRLYDKNSKKRHRAPSTRKICNSLSIAAQREGPKVKVMWFLIDPRYNWGEYMFLSFRVAPRLLACLVITYVPRVMCLL